MEYTMHTHSHNFLICHSANVFLIEYDMKTFDRIVNKSVIKVDNVSLIYSSIASNRTKISKLSIIWFEKRIHKRATMIDWVDCIHEMEEVYTKNIVTAEAAIANDGSMFFLNKINQLAQYTINEFLNSRSIYMFFFSSFALLSVVRCLFISLFSTSTQNFVYLRVYHW